jgi:hypothetical protein
MLTPLIRTLISVFLFGYGTNVALCQSDFHEVRPSWGKPIQKAQLSISMTNSVIERGSSISVFAVLTNASTNTIYIVQLAKSSDFDLFLTNRAGKVYHLIPPFLIGSTRTIPVYPAASNSRWLSVTIGTNVERGDYLLKATRFFGLNDERFQIESASLNVQLK